MFGPLNSAGCLLVHLVVVVAVAAGVVNFRCCVRRVFGSLSSNPYTVGGVLLKFCQGIVLYFLLMHWSRSACARLQQTKLLDFVLLQRLLDTVGPPQDDYNKRANPPRDDYNERQCRLL